MRKRRPSRGATTPSSLSTSVFSRSTGGGTADVTCATMRAESWNGGSASRPGCGSTSWNLSGRCRVGGLVGWGEHGWNLPGRCLGSWKGASTSEPSCGSTPWKLSGRCRVIGVLAWVSIVGSCQEGVGRAGWLAGESMSEACQKGAGSWGG
eukprot:361696-Chlamydomonas_euryale.AAC.4